MQEHLSREHPPDLALNRHSVQFSTGKKVANSFLIHHLESRDLDVGTWERVETKIFFHSGIVGAVRDFARQKLVFLWMKSMRKLLASP